MINKIIIQGRLVHDPDLRYTHAGDAYVRLRIAYNEIVKGVKKSHFFSAVAFGKTAENICEHMEKGRMILLEGSLDYSTYMHHDVQREKIQIKIWRFHFCDDKKKEKKKEITIEDLQPEDIDDVPF